MTQRFTPEMVQAAYEATGLKPIQGCLLNTAIPGACAVGVLAIHKFGRDALSQAPEQFALLGYTHQYLRGVVRGFDGREPNLVHSAHYALGYEDGVRIRQVILGQ